MTAERLHKRFDVPDGFVTLALKRPLHLGWAKPGKRMRICNMSLRGIHFVGHGAPPREDAELRMTIHANGFPAFQMTSRVRRVEPIKPVVSGQGGVRKWGCACEFTSYDERSWTHLRVLEARMRKLAAEQPRLGAAEDVLAASAAAGA